MWYSLRKRARILLKQQPSVKPFFFFILFRIFLFLNPHLQVCQLCEKQTVFQQKIQPEQDPG